MKRLLLCGVAAGALAALPAAAEPLPMGWWGSVEGGVSFPFAQDEGIYAIDRAGYPDMREVTVGSGLGFNGRVGIGYRFRGGWDAGIFVGGLVSNEKTEQEIDGSTFAPPGNRPRYSAGGPPIDVISGYENGYEFSAVRGTQDNLYVTIDFEAGYDAMLEGETSLRLFGGLRVAFFDNDLDAKFGYADSDPFGYEGSMAFQRENSFVGVGPRLGAQGWWGLGGGFSLFGAVGGSVLFGNLDHRYSVSAYGQSATLQEEEFRTVFQVEGELGVGLALAESVGLPGRLEIGYQAEYWFNAFDTRTEGQTIDPPLQDLRFGEQNGSIGYHGPFVRVVVPF